MSYEVACPNGHKLRVDPANFGKKAKCARCGIVFVVPDLRPGGQGGQPAPDVELPESGEQQAAPPLNEPEGPAPSRPSFPPASRRGAAGLGLLGINMTVAQAMLLVGLILVLVARGCDSLGVRAAARATAKAQEAQNEFTDRWETKTLDLAQRTEELREKKNPTADDTKALDKLRDDGANLNKDMEKERTKLQRGEWRELGRASRDVATNNQLMGYWRELLFVVGTVFLTIGLIAVGIQGEGAQRWICLLMVAIITFSLYIGGIAWALK